MNSNLPPFEIRVAVIQEGSVRIEVSGELDLATSPRFGQAVRRELDAGRKVIVDLSEIAFIDSTGLNALIMAVRGADANGGALELSPSLSEQVRRVFEITGLDAVLPISAE
jgi:anti-anti-sigma factor